MNADVKVAPTRTGFPLSPVFLGLTAILVGYFLVWLPGPSAGLRLIGIELGEWIKFLGVGSRRDLFYLPPIVVGVVLGLVAATWPNDRPQTWLARALAIAVALLSLPAIAAIQMEPRSEWMLRLASITFVTLVAMLGAMFSRRAAGSPWPWLLMGGVALLGAILPTIQYLAVRPVVEEIFRHSVEIGPGVWLNMAGSLIVATATLSEFFRLRRPQK